MIQKSIKFLEEQEASQVVVASGSLGVLCVLWNTHFCYLFHRESLGWATSIAIVVALMMVRIFFLSCRQSTVIHEALIVQRLESVTADPNPPTTPPSSNDNDDQNAIPVT